MHSVGIVGGTGYTGVELLRLLLPHPEVEVKFVSSRAQSGERLDAVFPSLRGHTNLEFSSPETSLMKDCDIVFFATPNGTALKQAPEILDHGTRVIDLSADFRLRDPVLYEQWYKTEHTARDWLAQAVYGLPELYRSDIAEARLIANPGCYPTAVQLGFLPLLEKKVVNVNGLIADAKSGTSGAGRGAAVPMLLAEAADSFCAYAVAGHRHLPEIEQGLTAMAGERVSLTFTPHLLPMIRGIHATLYATLTEAVDLQGLFEERFLNEPFVDVMPAGSHPQTRSVRGSNRCQLAVHQPQGRSTAVVLAVEDNLVKGAAGQAVQNMNLMLGLEEASGLQQLALSP